jgi:hypothetical protein
MDKFEVMSLSEEERQKFERDFRYLIDKYIEYLTQYNRFLVKENRSDDEETEFQTVQRLLLSIGEVLSMAMQALGDDLFGKAVGLYYEYKEAAYAGDADALHVLKELKPMFEASLNARINKN